MCGCVGNSYSLAIATCQGGTAITSGWATCGWLIGDRPTCILLIDNPSIGGPIGRSTSEWLTSMSPISI
jgi:hypothetical protein